MRYIYGILFLSILNFIYFKPYMQIALKISKYTKAFNKLTFLPHFFWSQLHFKFWYLVLSLSLPPTHANIHSSLQCSKEFPDVLNHDIEYKVLFVFHSLSQSILYYLFQLLISTFNASVITTISTLSNSFLKLFCLFVVIYSFQLSHSSVPRAL